MIVESIKYLLFESSKEMLLHVVERKRERDAKVSVLIS